MSEGRGRSRRRRDTTWDDVVPSADIPSETPSSRGNDARWNARLEQVIRQKRTLDPKLCTVEEAAGYIKGLYTGLEEDNDNFYQFTDLQTLPAIFACYDHQDLRAETVQQGKEYLKWLKEPEACRLLRNFALSDMWQDRPERIGQFLGWFFACAPERLLENKVSTRLLNVFVASDGTAGLMLHTLESLPDIAFGLQFGHGLSRMNTPLHLTSNKFGLCDLKCFVISQMPRESRPHTVRDHVLPDPMFHNRDTAKLAHSKLALMRRIWDAAEERLGIKTDRRERIYRARVKRGPALFHQIDGRAAGQVALAKEDKHEFNGRHARHRARSGIKVPAVLG